MEAMFDSCKRSITEITRSCLDSELYADECLKMAKYVAKCALVLSEIEIVMYGQESLRGNQALFRGLDHMGGVLQQVAQLVAQYGGAQEGGVWPLEDAVEFQAAALELQLALAGLGKVSNQLPQDVVEDLQHFVRQLEGLQFTTSELRETEELLQGGRQHPPPHVPGGGCEAQGASSPAPGFIQVRSGATEAAAAAEGDLGNGHGGHQQPSSPLPVDPFGMDGRVQSGTVRELEGLKLRSPSHLGKGADGGGEEGLGEEAALEARADNQDVLRRRRQQGRDGGLAGLADLAQVDGRSSTAGLDDRALGGIKEEREAAEAEGWRRREEMEEGGDGTEEETRKGLLERESEVALLTENPVP